MFIEQYRSLVLPYNNHLDTEFINDLVNTEDYTETLVEANVLLTRELVKHNEDILGYMEAHDIDPNLYRYCKTIPASTSFFNSRDLSFNLIYNGKSVAYWSDITKSAINIDQIQNKLGDIQYSFNELEKPINVDGEEITLDNKLIEYYGEGTFPIIHYDEYAYDIYDPNSLEHKFVKRYLADHPNIRRYGDVPEKYKSENDEWDDDEINANVYKEERKFKYKNKSASYLKYKFVIIHSHLYIFSINEFEANESLYLFTTKIKGTSLHFHQDRDKLPENVLIINLNMNNGKLEYTEQISDISLKIPAKFIHLKRGVNLADYLQERLDDYGRVIDDNNNVVISFLINCGIYKILTSDQEKSNMDMRLWDLSDIGSENGDTYVLYKGMDIDDWLESEIYDDYYDVLYNDEITYFNKLTNNKLRDLNPSYKELYSLTDQRAYNHLTKSDKDLARYIFNKSYDLYTAWNRINNQQYYRFNYTDLPQVDKTMNEVTHALIDDGKPDNNLFVKIAVSNFHHQPLDIFINGLYYSGNRHVEREHHWDMIYISKIALKTFFKNNKHLKDKLIKYDKKYYAEFIDPDYLHEIYFDVVKRDHAHSVVKYQNITENYNGVLIPGKEILDDTRYVYDNGYYIGNEYELTAIPPTQIIAMFPKYVMDHHAIDLTFNSSDNIHYSQTIRAKYRNFTHEDKVLAIDRSSKVIMNNLMWVDYIDYRFHLIVNNTMMYPDIHFKILAPNLIMFIKLPWTLTKDDYIDVTIKYPGVVEEEIIDTFRDKSILYNMYNDREAREEIYNKPLEEMNSFMFDDNINIIDNIIRENYPEKYDDEIFRHHMFLTKYFSSEMTLEGNATSYGLNWIRSMINEFPEFLRESGFYSTLPWKEIHKLGITEDGITLDERNGGLRWEEITEENILKIKGIYKRYLIDTNIDDDVIKYPERLIFNENTERGREEKQRFETELTAINKKIKKDKITKQEYLDFIEKYSYTIYDNLVDGVPTGEPIRYFKPLPVPRLVRLPEIEPLNVILTNHIVFVNNYYDKLLHMRKHTDLQIDFDNNADINKHLYGYSFIDNLTSNVIQNLLTEDTVYLSTLPINYLIDESQPSPYNSEDPYYIQADPLPKKSLDSEINSKHVLVDKVNPADERFINIIPYISKDGKYSSVDIEYLAINKHVPLTLRTLLERNNFILDNIQDFVYLSEGKVINVPLHTDLKNTIAPFIGSVTDVPALLVPRYKSYSVSINMGTSDDYKVGEQIVPIILNHQIPFIRFKNDLSQIYPHLDTPGISEKTITEKLYNDYNLTMSQLHRYNENNHVPKLYNKDKNEVFDLSTGATFIPRYSDEKYYHYYDEVPVDVNVPSKEVRIFSVGETNSFMRFSSPEFILPPKVDLIENGIYYNYTEYYTDKYKNNNGKNFIDYIMTPTYINNANKIKYSTSTAADKANIQNYLNYIKDINKFDTYINKEGKREITTLNYLNDNNIKSVLELDLDVFIDKNLMLHIININTDDEVIQPLIPYVDSRKLGNISISELGEPLYAYAENDLDKDFDYNNSEIKVTKDRPVLGNDNFAAITHNVIPTKNNIEIYKFDEYEIPEKQFKHIVTLDLENITKEDLDKLLKLNRYIYYKFNNKYYRTLDLDVIKLLAYLSYNNKSTKENEIIFIHNAYGELDINSIYEKYKLDYNVNVDEDLIAKWVDAYGSYKYRPRRQTWKQFVDNKSIDIALVHNGFKLEIVLENDLLTEDNEYNIGRFLSKVIYNRETGDSFFYISGDGNFINIVKSPTNTNENNNVLNNFINSKETQDFSFVKAYAIDPYYKNKVLIPDTYNNNLLNMLYYTGRIDPITKSRLISQIPTIRLHYKLNNNTYNIKDMYETKTNDEVAKLNFYKNNFIGIRVGMGNNIYLKEYKHFFENTRL